MIETILIIQIDMNLYLTTLLITQRIIIHQATIEILLLEALRYYKSNSISTNRPIQSIQIRSHIKIEIINTIEMRGVAETARRAKIRGAIINRITVVHNISLISIILSIQTQLPRRLIRFINLLIMGSTLLGRVATNKESHLGSLIYKIHRCYKATDQMALT